MSRFALLCLLCMGMQCLLEIGSTACGDQSCSASEEQAEELGHKEAAVAKVEMLQWYRTPTKPNPLGARAEPMLQTASPIDLRTALPLAWTHVPKCGSSLINALIRLPGACPGLLSNDTDVVYDAFPLEVGQKWSKSFLRAFPDWAQSCRGLQVQPEGTFFGQHLLVGSSFDDVYDGHGVIMLRQPEQRLISMYNHMANLENLRPGGIHGVAQMSASSFANASGGCAVRMLTNEQPADTSTFNAFNACVGCEVVRLGCRRMEVSGSDVLEAQRRLRRYASVGITDEWDLSICLLHRMFGGVCHPVEFEATGKTRSSAKDTYDTSILEGVVDKYDGALYEEALSIFAENLRRYDVSRDSCRECFQSGGLDGE